MGSKILACPTWEPCQLCAVEVHDRGFAMGGQSQNINGGTGWGGGVEFQLCPGRELNFWSMEL